MTGVQLRDFPPFSSINSSHLIQFSRYQFCAFIYLIHITEIILKDKLKCNKIIWNFKFYKSTKFYIFLSFRSFLHLSSVIILFSFSCTNIIFLTDFFSSLFVHLIFLVLSLFFLEIGKWIQFQDTKRSFQLFIAS